jgi:hypothetical protein
LSFSQRLYGFWAKEKIQLAPDEVHPLMIESARFVRGVMLDARMRYGELNSGGVEEIYSLSQNGIGYGQVEVSYFCFYTWSFLKS